MMKHRINKMAAIFIASIFALSGLGIAYAAWTDTITIDGTVTTGEVCWEFTWCDLHDDDAPVNPGGDYPTNDPDSTCNPGFVRFPDGSYIKDLDKNVAWGTQYILDLDQDGCKETLALTLNNVYPCYFNELSFYTRNCGSIPIKFDHVAITVNQNTYYIYDGMPKLTFDLSGNGIPDFEIWWKEDYFGYQMEPDGDGPEMSFWMHVLQDEASGVQGQSFTIYISLVAVQWNAYPLP